MYNRAFEVQLDGRNSNTNQVFTLDSSYCVSGESAVATFDLLEEYETELVSKDFKTWNTLPYGSGTSYKTGQTINIVKDTTLYAQYEDKATSGITINKTAETIMKGDTLQLTAAITPADSKDTILWETSDSSIATVDKNGLVTGIENGTVVITAKSKKNPEVTVTVYVMVVAYTVRIPSTFMLNTPATISASVSSNKYKLDVSLESLSVLSDDNGNSYELVAEDASEEEYVALEEGDVLLSTTNKANMKLRFTTAIPAKLIKKGNYTAEVVFRVSRAKK